MPNGNVGTPTKVFLELIRACRLPASIIGKLGLEFPRTRAKRMYSSVPFDYGIFTRRRQARLAKLRQANGTTEDDTESFVRTGKGDLLSENMQEPFKRPRQVENDCSEEEKESGSDDDDDTCEEWERHEAFYNDVTSQERTKERLFEEEIELKWEKGGSGLVFYTDAQFWDEKDGDFDEKTADDWDVDMSIYYEAGAGDKDAKDMREMRKEKRLRSGSRDSAVNKDCFEHEVGRIGQFERHTKGIGKRVMEKQGWREGQGLGKTISGIAEPIEENGQKPWDKKGLGYRGEKLIRTFGVRPRAHNRGNVIINTVYDNPSTTDPQSPLLRSSFPNKLSHRTQILKPTKK